MLATAMALEVEQLAQWMQVFADQLSLAIPLSAAVAGKQRLQALNMRAWHLLAGPGMIWPAVRR